MAMTNLQIIETEKALRGITVEIHTFQKWKSLGYQVRKGEKALASFAIWKHCAGKPNENAETGETETGRGFCRLKVSHFFGENQVEPIPAKI